MKAWKIAGISAVVMLALAALGAGYAFAQTPTPPPPGYGWGGMMGAYGMMGGSGQSGNGYGWMDDMHQWMSTTGSMHTVVWDGLADALGLTPEELNQQLTSGKTLAQVAEAQGVSQEQLAAALEKSVKAGLDTAVADGVLTQEQADWMLSHRSGNWGSLGVISHMGNFSTGFGPGGCHGNFAPQRNS